MTNQTFFVGRGERIWAMDLTYEGAKQSSNAVKELISRGVGESAIILYGDEHTIGTGKYIAKGLGAGSLVQSEAIGHLGKYPQATGDLDATLERALEIINVSRAGRDIVAVTHLPLIAHLALGDQSEKMPYGTVVEYPAESWKHQDFSPTSVYSTDLVHYLR